MDRREDLWKWWLSVADDFDDHVGDLAFEAKVRGAYAQYRSVYSDAVSLAVLDGGATFPLLRNIDNPFPGTSIGEAGRRLVQPENRAVLVRVYADAVSAVGTIPVSDGQDDPAATIRLSGLMLGLTADEMGTP